MAEQTVRIQIGGFRCSSPIRGHMTVDEVDADLGERNWSLGKGGYAVRHEGRRGAAVSTNAHREILSRKLGRPLEDAEFCDHINGDKLDNRRCNLRAVSTRMNAQNRIGLDPRNTSGFRGVAWDKQRKKYMARVKHMGIGHFCGRYDSAQAAAEAAAMKRETFGFLTSDVA